MFNKDRLGKRAHSPDNFGDNSYRDNSFRGQPSFRGNNFNKRQRGENQPLTIEDKIVRLGETGSRNIDIGLLAKEIDLDLMNKVDEEEKIKNITSKICTCIISFPTRVTTYATLIGLISVKHYNVSCQIINTLHASYPVYLEAQKWQEALTIVHLLSSLVNCKVIRPSALLSQFELLLEISLEDGAPQTRSDYYVYTILSSLPLVAQELSLQVEQQPQFESLLDTIEKYLSKRSRDNLNVTRAWLSNDSTVQMDYLDSLWVQTKNFRANGWNETFLHRPYNDKEYKDIMASSLIPQNSPTIQIPAHSSDYVYPTPKIVLRIFEDDVTEGHRSIPGSDKIERYCIENHIRNLIDEIPNDPRDCARHISHMYRSDHLAMKHILIETLLGEMFTLPQPRHQEILYQSLLYELTKIYHPSRNPDEIKTNYDTILNAAVKVLYDNLDSMNITCISRFIEWFSFHLNNTEFIFPWQSWSDATNENTNSSSKAIFVREILDRCVRFSFHKKISAMVSAHLDILMPPEVGVKKAPVFIDNPRLQDVEDSVDKLITERADAKSICETLNITIEGVDLPPDFIVRDEKLTDKLLKIDVFTAVILSKASRSLTHLSSAIGKYKNVFKSLMRVQGGQTQLLSTMRSCLDSHPQLQIILVDKLLKADLIEAKEVCNWVFSESMKPFYFNSYPWEILNNTITRVILVADKLIKEKKEKEQPNIEEEKMESGDADVEMKLESDEGLDEKIVQAKIAYQDLILQVCRMFSEVLGDHIRECNTRNKSYQDDWFRWVVGRLQQVYYSHYTKSQQIYDKIGDILSSVPDVGRFIVNLNL